MASPALGTWPASVVLGWTVERGFAAQRAITSRPNPHCQVPSALNPFFGFWVRNCYSQSPSVSGRPSGKEKRETPASLRHPHLEASVLGPGPRSLGWYSAGLRSLPLNHPEPDMPALAIRFFGSCGQQCLFSSHRRFGTLLGFLVNIKSRVCPLAGKLTL